MSFIGSSLYRFDDFELQPSRRLLLRAGERIPLAPKTFEVLLCLVQNAGRVVVKDDLFKAVWPGSFIEESNLTQHIFWLRKALSDKSGYIVTIPGRGYEFTAPVVTLPEHEAPTQPPPDPLPQPTAPVFTLQRTLERTQMVFEETAFVPTPAAQPSPWRLGATVAASVLLLSGLGAWGTWRWVHRPVPGDHHEVVLAEFENSTGDPGFDRALNSLLAIDLSQSPFLLVAADGDTRKVLKLMNRSADEPLTAPVAREVCQRLNDQVVLGGLIANFGGKYLVTLTATDCADGKTLVQTKSVADSRDAVLKSVDAVAAEMRERLGEPLKSRQATAQPLQLAHTFSLDALRVYSEARSLQSQLKCQEAVPHFQRAIELDPKFAAAWAHLSDCFYHLDEYDHGAAAITKAYELRDEADEAERLSINFTYHSLVTSDIFASIRDLEAWTQMYPAQVEAWTNLADMQNQVGRPDLGIDAAQHALALNPANAGAWSILARDQLRAGRLDDARATCRDAITRKFDGQQIHSVLLEAAYLQHDLATVAEQVAWAKGTRAEPRFTWEQASIALTEGRIHTGVALWLDSAEQYKKQGLSETADRVRFNLPREETEVGLTEQARKLLASFGSEGEDYPDLMIALADTGQPDRAQALLDKATARDGNTTQWKYYGTPWVKAAIALAHHDPPAALAALEPGIPFDLHDYALPAMRGRAYLAASQPGMAATEFRKILDHPGIEPLGHNIPLAHLGLARALEMQADHAAAHKEYEALFALWKDADPDLPVLKLAHEEYAKIP